MNPVPGATKTEIFGLFPGRLPCPGDLPPALAHSGLYPASEMPDLRRPHEHEFPQGFARRSCACCILPRGFPTALFSTLSSLFSSNRDSPVKRPHHYRLFRFALDLQVSLGPPDRFGSFSCDGITPSLILLGPVGNGSDPDCQLTGRRPRKLARDDGRSYLLDLLVLFMGCRPRPKRFCRRSQHPDLRRRSVFYTMLSPLFRT